MCCGRKVHRHRGIDPLSLFQLGSILISLQHPRLVLPCPTQQCWPRCQLCFRAKMCFKSCCRMVMCCATCQPVSILRQMGEAVVKKQAFLGWSQRVIYHIKARRNRGLSYGICFPKDTIFFRRPPIIWCQWNLAAKASFSQLTFKIKKHFTEAC